jgi:signal transduction histidine kinase
LVTRTKSRNLVFLCDRAGNITGIISDNINLNKTNYVGKELSCLFDKANKRRAIDLIEKVKNEKLVIDYEIPLIAGDGEIILVFTGIDLNEKILIAGTDTYDSFNTLFDEMSKITNEQVNIIRELSREKKRTAKLERKRIEQDLHDSVSQTLFSTRIIAEILPDLWKKDKKEGERQLEKLKLLTIESLNEMRRLLLELRPGSFSEENLEDLLKQLVNSAKLRSDINIQLEIKGKKDLEIKVKESIYRVIQESLNNIMKHSEADKANIKINFLKDKTILEIEDNGKGFDINNVSTKKLGLFIMKERAKSLNASLQIKSRKERGTSITLKYNNKSKD